MSTAAAATAAKRIFIPMTKYDAVKGIAYGVAASSTLDRAGEIFDYAGSKPYFEKWSAAAIKATAGKSMGNLRAMHGGVAAGKLDALTFNDDDELIEVAAKVVDPVEQKKCEEGVYTGFSMGGKYIKRWKAEADAGATRYIADPYEISLVDLPCIPDATFEYVKAEGAAPELRKFHVATPAPAAAVVEPTNDAIAAKAQDLAKVAGKPDSWTERFGEARKALMERPEPAADLKPTQVLELATAAVEDPMDKNADLGAVQKWTHPDLSGQSFDKKDDLRAALAQKNATDSAARISAPVTEAIKSLTEVLDTKDPAGVVVKNSSDNPDFASGGKGAKDGKGDPKKPDPKASADAKAKQKAKDESDKSKPMKSAVDVISRARAWLADPVPSYADRRAILKAAGEFDAMGVLPDGFIEQGDDIAKLATPELKKMASLYQVSSLISLVAQLESFHSGLMGQSGYYYGDSGSITVVEASPELMTRISTMCDELGSAAATLLDEVLSAMKTDDAAKAVGRGTVLGDLHKIGARNSAADKTRLNKAHDLLAEIDPAMCGSSKALDEGDLKKMLDASEAAFAKTMGDLVPVLKDIAERVKRIEAQPVAGRPTSVTLVEKGSMIEQVMNGTANETLTANHEAFIQMTSDRNGLALPRR